MRKSSKKATTAGQKKVDEFKLKVNKEKEELTVDIIQYNHKIEKLLQQMSLMIHECDNIDKSKFVFQRELLSRNRMNMRVINSAIKMIHDNKLQLWMIDDKAIEDKVKNEK